MGGEHAAAAVRATHPGNAHQPSGLLTPNLVAGATQRVMHLEHPVHAVVVGVNGCDDLHQLPVAS